MLKKFLFIIIQKERLIKIIFFNNLIFSLYKV